MISVVFFVETEACLKIHSLIKPYKTTKLNHSYFLTLKLIANYLESLAQITEGTALSHNFYCAQKRLVLEGDTSRISIAGELTAVLGFSAHLGGQPASLRADSEDNGSCSCAALFFKCWNLRSHIKSTLPALSKCDGNSSSACSRARALAEMLRNSNHKMCDGQITPKRYSFTEESQIT